MNVFQRLRWAMSPKNSIEDTWETANISTGDGFVKSAFPDKTMSEVTYYTCMKILLESVAKLSVHLKDEDNKKIQNHEATILMKSRPNPYMSPSDFKGLMEFNRNHHGNSYAYINHDKKGNLVGLHPLDPTKVKLIVDNAKILESQATYLYEYRESESRKFYFNDKDILHLKGGISYNGIVGKSIREELASTISGVKESQKYLNSLYERGLTANAVIQYTGDLDKAKRKELVKNVMEIASDPTTGNLLPLPLGMNLIPLDLKLADAQFFELKKFTSLQIAAACGIKPNHLNNYDKSSYANSEMQNLTFYVDTLLYILKKWEEELNYKLLTTDELKKGYHFEFNVATILRGDIKTQAEALSKFVTSSIYKVDEARGYLGMPKLENGEGDVVLVNGTYTKLEKVGAAYDGGEKKSD